VKFCLLPLPFAPVAASLPTSAITGSSFFVIENSDVVLSAWHYSKIAMDRIFARAKSPANRSIRNSRQPIAVRSLQLHASAPDPKGPPDPLDDPFKKSHSKAHPEPGM
jgi:hypothetical protein